jgi:hypothetical protein
MSLVNNIDTVYKSKVTQEFEGLVTSDQGVFIILGGQQIPLLNAQGQVAQNRLTELSEPIRDELRGQYADAASLMTAFTKRVQQEIDLYFVNLVKEIINTIQAKIKSEQKILDIYESRIMMDFLSDTSFKTQVGRKVQDLEEFMNEHSLNKISRQQNDPVILNLQVALTDIIQRHRMIFEVWNNFQSVMSIMMDLTKKVKVSAQTPVAIKDRAINNLKLVSEITFQEMAEIPNMSGLSSELQKQLLTTTMTKADLIQALKHN